MRPVDSDRDVVLDGVTMHLRQSELDAVIAGLGAVDASAEGHTLTLAAALRALPATDRAPTWELMMRRYARRTPLAAAAGQIGMDSVHAQRLLDALDRALAAVPAPER